MSTCTRPFQVVAVCDTSLDRKGSFDDGVSITENTEICSLRIWMCSLFVYLII